LNGLRDAGSSAKVLAGPRATVAQQEHDSMCFSPAASFFTAAITGASGVAALRRTSSRREWPLAAIPLFFSAQQVSEGALWLTLPSEPAGPVCLALTDTFLFFALLFWPIFAPLAALLVEDDASRRRLIGCCLLVGIGVSFYLGGVLVHGTHVPLLKQNHIIYDTVPPPAPAVGFFYLIATGLALALSSHRAVNLLSMVVVAGSVAAWFAYWDAYLSVWCFFAASASILILLHFERARAANIPAARLRP
jgi:hypothetical protein